MKKILLLFSLLTINAFSQTPGNGVTDIDSNHYNSVNIGTQEWMKENLNVSKYNDGTIIPQVTFAQWANLTTGAWCYYNNDPTNGAIYGKLYNWYAVAGIYDAASLIDISLRKQLAPVGWHVSSDAELITLINYLDPNANGGATPPHGGAPATNLAGAALKETGAVHWWDGPNPATNSTGFTALPGGSALTSISAFSSINWECDLWSSSEYEQATQNSWYLYLDSYTTSARRIYVSKNYGMSVRCINNIALNNQSFNINSFNIYPNPANEQFTIDCSNNSNVIDWSYKIVNTLGQEVLNGMLNSQQNIVQLNNIKCQGVYFVKIYDNSNTLVDTKKIIIQE